MHKGQVLLKLEGIDTVEAAEALRGHWVLVPLEQAKKLPRGAYYLYQIVGLEVYTTAGQYIGKVEEVLSAAANDVYIVKGPGVQDQTGELLVPAIKAVVKRIEIKRGRLVIAPPEEWA
jgi:16S rRNA processing protein RimM